MPVDMTPARWQYTTNYSNSVFGLQDAHLAGLMNEAVAAGLPDIAVSADVGRLLKLLVSMTCAKLVIEVGALAGYSTIWLARGLSPGGKVITIEYEPKHAEVVRRNIQTAGVADRVDVRVGAGLDVLPILRKELGTNSVDVVFLDAVKTEYPDYWKIVRDMIKPGGLILADNVYGGGDWWIDVTGNASRDAADRFNRLVVADPDYEAVAVPIREGVLIGRRMR